MKKTIKRLLLSLKNRNVKLCSGSNVKYTAKFEGFNVIGKNSEFEGFLGLGSYIGASSVINGKIGRFCSIGSNVHFVVGEHPMKYVSTSPSFYSNRGQNTLVLYHDKNYKEFRFVEPEMPVVIENDVWIGDGASIIHGVRICNGAVVLANATVTKDVPPYAIVAGTPARIIKYRFDEDVISQLLKICWWDKPLPWLKEHAPDFSNVVSFINSCTL